MKKYTITTIFASGLAALAIGLAAPVTAAPSGPNDNTGGNGGTSQRDIPSANDWLTHAGMTPYGTYQNLNPRHSGSRR